MSLVTSSLKIVVVSALTASSATLIALWPTGSHAEPQPPVAALAPGETALGGAIASGKLVSSAAGTWSVEVTARNPHAHDSQVVELRPCVYRTTSSPMSRVLPSPQQVWLGDDRVELAPGQQAVRRYALPADLSASITKAQRSTSKKTGAATAAYFVRFGPVAPGPPPELLGL